MFWNRNNQAAANPTNTRVVTPMRRTSTPATFTYNNAYNNGYNNGYNNNNYSMNSNSSVYKLYYFPIRNTVEASRMILNYAGVPFEDIRITAEAWPAWKASKFIIFTLNS